MQTYGTAQTTGHLRSGPIAEIHSAKLGVGDGPRAAVKAFSPPAGYDAPGPLRSAAARFLESAWDQSEAAQQTDAGWAAVHDFGQQDGKPYLITDAYAASLDDLIAPGRQVSARLLREVVLQVVTALESAERLLGRAHGNLKPSNVLVDYVPGDDSALARLGLCDPAPGSVLGRRTGIHRDRQDLGRLIVSLVTGVSSAEVGAWPVPASPEWGQLGTVGEGWRTLAGDLLSPDQAEQPIAWNEVLRRADLLVAPVVRKPKWPWAVAAALFLVAAGLTAYLIIPRNTTPPATFDELVLLARESRNWAATAQGQLTDTSTNYADIQAFVQAHPEAAEALDGRLFGQNYYPMQPSALLEQDNRFYSTLLSAVDQHAVNPGPDTQQTIDDTVAFLESNRTAARRAKAALDAVLAARTDLEAYIEQLGAAADDEPARHPDSARLMQHYTAYASGAFDNDQHAALSAIMQLQQARKLLQQIETARQTAQDRSSLNDPFITALQEELQAQRAEIARTPTDAEPNHQALLDLADRAQRIQRIVLTVSDPSRVHYASFLNAHRPLYEAFVDASTLAQWESSVLQPGPAHVPQDTPDPRPALSTSDRIDEMQALVTTLKVELGDDENADDRQDDLAALSQDIQTLLANYAWTNAQRESVQTAAASVAVQLDELKTQIQIDINNASRDMAIEIPLLQAVTLTDIASPAVNVAHYFEVLGGQPISPSDAMERAWATLRDRIVADVQRDQSKPIVLQRKIQDAVLALHAVDSALPADLLDQQLAPDIAITRWSRDDTLDRYRQLRDEAIDNITPGLRDALASSTAGSFSDAGTGVPGLVAARRALEQWVDQAGEVLRSYDTINTYFASYHAPDERVARSPADAEQVELSALWRETQSRASAPALARLGDDLAETDAQYSLLVALYRDVATLNAQRDTILDTLQAQPGDDFAQALLQAAQDESQDPAVRVGATLAALTLYTPAEVDELAQLLGLRPTYTELVSAQAQSLSADRVQTICDRLDRRASTAWQLSLNAAADAQTAEDLLALSSTTPAIPHREQLDPAAEMLGGARNQLSPISKTNIYLDRYQTRLNALVADGFEDEEEDRRAAMLAQELHDRLADHRLDDGRIEQICARLEIAIRQHNEGGIQRTDDAGLGPEVDWLGALGVVVTQVDPETDAPLDEDTGELAALRKYRFILGENGTPVFMTFRLVQPAQSEIDLNAPPAYISTSEVPVGFMIDILNATQSQQDFVQAANLGLVVRDVSPLWIATQNSAQQLTGIKRFDWDDELWNVGSSAQAPWVSRHSTENQFRTIAAEGNTREPVGPNHPMQVINASGATFFANLLGCRLPKLTEWQTAVVNAGGLDECVLSANLRDLSWQRQQDYLVQQAETQVPVVWTSEGSYTESDFFFPLSPQGAAAEPRENAKDDNAVWPRAVRMDGDAFTDLVGNVAEWVVRDAGDLDALGRLVPTARPDAATLFDSQRTQWAERNFYVIGGSAISCGKTCAYDTPVHMVVEQSAERPGVAPGRAPSNQRRARGYSDVGFRLAFTVGQPRLMVTVTALLKDDFLPPDAPE